MIEVYAKLFDLLDARARRRFVLLACIMVAVSLSELIGISSVLLLLGVLADPGRLDDVGAVAWARAALGLADPFAFQVALAGAVSAVVALGLVVKAGGIYAILRFSQSCGAAISCRMLDAYLRFPYDWFLSRNTADIANNVLDETDRMVGQVLEPALRLLGSVLLAFVIVGFLVSVDPIVALAAAASVGGLYAAIFAVLRPHLLRLGQQTVEANRARYRIASEASGGLKELKLLGLEDGYVRRFEEPARQRGALPGAVRRHGRVAALCAGGGGLHRDDRHGSGADAAQRRRSGGRDPGDRHLRFRRPAAAAGAAADLPHLRADPRGQAGARRAAHRLPRGHGAARAPADAGAGHGTAAAGRGAGDRRSAVQLSGRRPRRAARRVIVGARAQHDRPRRRNRGGKDHAGRSDAGTAASDAGAIRVDGRALDRETLRAWQQNIGYVPQVIYLTDATVAENIAFGMPRDRIDMDAVERAARIAALHDFVTTELPDGYDTFVGERGVRLSGGQRQRIGIARALYHDPALLIMDEATSALDTLTEKLVMDAVQRIRQDKTVVLIAHRLSTVRHCDRIYLLEHGVVADSGTFDDLVASSDTFRRMAAAG